MRKKRRVQRLTNPVGKNYYIKFFVQKSHLLMLCKKRWIRHHWSKYSVKKEINGTQFDPIAFTGGHRPPSVFPNLVYSGRLVVSFLLFFSRHRSIWFSFKFLGLQSMIWFVHRLFCVLTKCSTQLHFNVAILSMTWLFCSFVMWSCRLTPNIARSMAHFVVLCLLADLCVAVIVSSP